MIARRPSRFTPKPPDALVELFTTQRTALALHTKALHGEIADAAAGAVGCGGRCRMLCPVSTSDSSSWVPGAAPHLRGS
jgi:hypothetical protein